MKIKILTGLPPITFLEWVKALPSLPIMQDGFLWRQRLASDFGSAALEAYDAINTVPKPTPKQYYIQCHSVPLLDNAIRALLDLRRNNPHFFNTLTGIAQGEINTLRENIDALETWHTLPAAQKIRTFPEYQGYFQAIMENLANDLVTIDGTSALYASACQNDLALTKMLIDNGADVNRPRNDGETPLLEAAQSGHTNLARFLIQHGANVNQPNIRGYTPLHEAVRLGHANLVTALIENGANVNLPNEDGDTSLHTVASNQDIAIATTLIQHGANVNQLNTMGQSPLHRAIYRQQTDLVKLLIQHGANVNQLDTKGKSPLYFAIETGHAPLIELLIQHGANVNQHDKRGHSLLDYAQNYDFHNSGKLLAYHVFKSNTVAQISQIKTKPPGSYDFLQTLHRKVNDAADVTTKLALLQEAIAVDADNLPAHALSAYFHEHHLKEIQDQITQLTSTATSAPLTAAFSAESSSSSSSSSGSVPVSGGRPERGPQNTG